MSGTECPSTSTGRLVWGLITTGGMVVTKGMVVTSGTVNITSFASGISETRLPIVRCSSAPNCSVATSGVPVPEVAGPRTSLAPYSNETIVGCRLATCAMTVPWPRVMNEKYGLSE